MNSQYQVKLNLILFNDELPSYEVFRYPEFDSETKPTEECFLFSLPIGRETDKRKRYWVQFNKCDEFEEFVAQPLDNVYLTKRALFYGLSEVITREINSAKFTIPSCGIFEEIQFNFHEDEDGIEQLVVRPYYLRISEKFGWIANYHFRVHEGVPFSRHILQRSLTLDKNNRKNLNYCLDRTQKTRELLRTYKKILDATQLPGAKKSVITHDDFVSLPAKQLNSKEYLFAENRQSQSQFIGLKTYGPLSPLTQDPNLLFAFRECDRPVARTLAMALLGSTNRQRFSYPSFESLFKIGVTVNPDPIILNDLSRASFEFSLRRVQAERELGKSVLPIFLLPKGDDNGYLLHKSIFTNVGIPTQVCTLGLVNDNYILKWSVANIALQIFCKLGGQPWIVRPTPTRTLIIGISQSHKIKVENGVSTVSRYFAFSVMTENSGLFRKLEILGDASSLGSYIDALKSNLSEILQKESSEYSQVVIHASFRLKKTEMQAIADVVRTTTEKCSQNCRFSVVKVNQKNDYFGTNPCVNSLVPYEGTVSKLGGGEYLVWFEGISPDNQTVTKAFPGPTHVKFLRASSEDSIADELILQDLVNLSGANWRGFNAKNAPVSVFYCHLIAEFVRKFQEQDLPLPQVQELQPWFL